MKQCLHLTAIMVIAAVFTRCSTLALDKGRLGGIKKVAVVGFVVAQEMPQGPQFKLGSWREDKMMPVWTTSLPHASEHSTEMYGRLGTALKKELRWTVTDRKTLEASAVYRPIYEKFMKGLQSRPPIGTNVEAFGATGILDPYPFERMTLEERQTLMKALGVDALAVATVRIRLVKAGGLKMLVGAGDFKPVAELSFAVYDMKGEAPVWRDLQAKGEVVAEGTSHVFGITDTKALLNQSIQAAQNSYETLITRYRDQNG